MKFLPKGTNCQVYETLHFGTAVSKLLEFDSDYVTTKELVLGEDIIYHAELAADETWCNIPATNYPRSIYQNGSWWLLVKTHVSGGRNELIEW